jgi:hypothetical protein
VFGRADDGRILVTLLMLSPIQVSNGTVYGFMYIRNPKTPWRKRVASEALVKKSVAI